MIAKILKLLNKRFPRNYIVRNPLWGSIIFFVFCFVFIIVYKPLNSHESRFFNYTVTMAVYCLIFSVVVYGLIRILKHREYFSDGSEWNFLKEIVSIVIILSGVGITIFISGFFMEEPSSRWNFPTFFDSYLSAFLVGIIPFAFFTLANYRHLFAEEIIQNLESNNNSESTPGVKEELIQIGSRLKKEELSFYPGQFIYAESDGNYVIFYLKDEQQIRKEVIRNSISEIEQQLSIIPFFFRTHRAFIVNVKKVISKKGNTLGYRLKLTDSTIEIPVSRQNTKAFDQVLIQYNHPFVTKNYHP